MQHSAIPSTVPLWTPNPIMRRVCMANCQIRLNTVPWEALLASQHFADEAERYPSGNLREVYFYRSQLTGHMEKEYHPGN